MDCDWSKFVTVCLFLNWMCVSFAQPQNRSIYRFASEMYMTIYDDVHVMIYAMMVTSFRGARSSVRSNARKISNIEISECWSSVMNEPTANGAPVVVFISANAILEDIQSLTTKEMWFRDGALWCSVNSQTHTTQRLQKLQ